MREVRVTTPPRRFVLRPPDPAVLRRMRPLATGDETLLQEFFRSHDANTIYERYGCLVATMTAERAHQLVSVDQTRDRALGIFSPGGRALHAVGRYCLDPKGDRAELAFVVREDQRGQGFATSLLRVLIAVARARGLRQLWAQVNSHNASMLGIFRRHGFTLTPLTDVGLVHATLDLPAAPGAPAPSPFP